MQYKYLKSGKKLEVIEYLIAENKILEIIENRDESSTKGKITRQEIIGLLDILFSYGPDLSNDIINQMNR